MASSPTTRRLPEVLADVSAGRVAPVYLLLGDDEAGKKPLIEALAALVEPDLQQLNVERFYASDSSDRSAIERAVDSARTFPMLGDRRVVFLMRAEIALKRAAAGASDEDEATATSEDVEETTHNVAVLLDYLEAPAPHACLVVVASDLNRGTKIGRALIQGAHVVEFWGLRAGREARGQQIESALGAADRYVRQRVKAAGKAIDVAAAEPLVEYAGTDIGLLRGAVDRVLLYCGDRPRITAVDVRAVVSGEASVDDWAVTNAIGAGDAPEALRQLRMVLEAGASPYMLLGQIGWYVRVKLSAMSPGRAAEAVRRQFACDLAMKTSGGDPQVLLERLVVELCGQGGASRRLRRS